MGVSTYELGPPSLFPSLLVTARIGCAILNQSVTAPGAATITTVVMGRFMTDRSEFGILHINPNLHGSCSASISFKDGYPAPRFGGNTPWTYLGCYHSTQRPT